jgi:ribonuclease E
VVEEKGPNASRNKLQTVTLLDTIEENQFDACLGGGRRDEERKPREERAPREERQAREPREERQPREERAPREERGSRGLRPRRGQDDRGDSRPRREDRDGDPAGLVPWLLPPAIGIRDEAPVADEAPQAEAKPRRKPLRRKPSADGADEQLESAE